MLYTSNISYTNYTSIKNYKNETLKEGDFGPTHWNLLSGELPMQCPLGQGAGHWTGKQNWPIAAQLYHLIQSSLRTKSSSSGSGRRE